MKTDQPPSLSDHHPSQRLVAIDVMRGIVMVLMTVDHAAHMFNAGHYVTDSVAFYQAGSAIPAAQFLTRWITHLCAPTFLFLAGWALALSIFKQEIQGTCSGSIDLYLLKRGLFILLLDPVWMSFAFGPYILFQVLYAIGGSLCCMIPLRRLGTLSLLTVGLVILLFSEGLVGLTVWLSGGEKPGLIGAFLVSGGRIGRSVLVLYPLLPWLAYLVLGWCCGRFFREGRIINPPLFFLRAGFFSLLVYGIVRGFNMYGNMLLYRYDSTLLQWLHVSKYPPSLTFSSLELGIMFLFLAILFAWYDKTSENDRNPLLVFGQTPLFFYVIHVHLLAAVAWLLDYRRTGGLAETWIATFGVLVVFYPLCYWYRRIKRKGTISVLRYI
jgi:uncharacterized membrane protein